MPVLIMRHQKNTLITLDDCMYMRKKTRYFLPRSIILLFLMIQGGFDCSLRLCSVMEQPYYADYIALY